MFAATLERVVRDALRLARRSDREALFAFLDDADVPPDNNRAEREIRPAAGR